MGEFTAAGTSVRALNHAITDVLGEELTGVEM
jgi:hypothetical protein